MERYISGNRTLSSSTDPTNAIELSINQSALFGQLYHCGGIVNADGTVGLSKGVGFTSTRVSTGVFNITFNSPHPSSIYMVSAVVGTTGRNFVSFSNTTVDGISR